MCWHCMKLMNTINVLMNWSEWTTEFSECANEWQINIHPHSSGRLDFRAEEQIPILAILCIVWARGNLVLYSIRMNEWKALVETERKSNSYDDSVRFVSRAARECGQGSQNICSEGRNSGADSAVGETVPSPPQLNEKRSPRNAVPSAIGHYNVKHYSKTSPLRPCWRQQI